MSYYGMKCTIISHIPKNDLISQIIPDLVAGNDAFFSVGSTEEGMVFNCNQFITYCKEEYFNVHFKEIMKQDVFCLPYVDENTLNTNSVLKSPFDTILKTMKSWCKKNRKGIMKGLVIYGYSLDSHLDFLKFPKYVSQNEQYCTLPEDLNQTVITYNPAEKVILLIKRARTKDLEYEMRLSVSDLIKFVLIYKPILENSGVTLLNLLLTDEVVDSYPWKCKFCKTQVISTKSLDSVQFFEQWIKTNLRNKSFSFKKKDSSHESNMKDFSLDFPAYILGFLAQFQSTAGTDFQGMLPSLTNNAENQIEESVIILPKQLRIVNSGEKRLIIKGCYGSGISIVARERAAVIAKTLEKREEEMLCYICHDSLSQQLKRMQNISQVKLFQNKNGKKLSDILNEIIKNETKQKTHVIVELYDIEDLDDAEVDKLNNLLRTDVKLKDSIVSIFCKPVEKKRMIDNMERKSNMTSDLDGMKMVELKYNTRNTIDLIKFLKLTVDAITKEEANKTFFPRDEDHTNNSSSDITGRSTSPTVQIVTSNHTLHETTGFESQIKSEESGKPEKSRETKSQLVNIAEPQIKKKMVKLNDAKKTSDEYSLTFDEALEYYATFNDNQKITKKIESTFFHIFSNKCAHNVNLEIPSMYQINHPKNSNEFQILLALVLQEIFRCFEEDGNRCHISELENLTYGYEGEKFVIVHFDVQNDIPQYFQLVFKLMGMYEKVTNKYEEFKRDEDKRILICSYRAFGGFDCKRVIIVLYPSIYYLKHYLPECISYSTAYLGIIVLTDVNLVDNPNMERETMKGVIDTWKNSPDRVKLQIIEMEICDVQNDFEEPQPGDVDAPGQLKFSISSNLHSKLVDRIAKISTVPDKNNQKEVNTAVER